MKKGGGLFSVLLRIFSYHLNKLSTQARNGKKQDKKLAQRSGLFDI